MKLTDLFKKEKSANIAKDRLTLMLAHERSVRIPYMEDMKNEIISVVKKYTNPSKVEIKTDSNQESKMLEVEITLG